jgi:hypothetical protein
MGMLVVLLGVLAPRAALAAEAAAEPKAGMYQIVSASKTSLGLGVKNGSMADKAPVRLLALGSGNAQKWRVSAKDGSGWRTISVVHSGGYLSANSSKVACISNSDKITNAQRWKIVATAKGCKLVNKAYGSVVLGPEGGTAKASVKLSLAKDKATKAQRFTFKSTKITKQTTSTPIMGSPKISKKVATRYLKDTFSAYGFSLPTKWRKDGVTLPKLVTWFYEEASDEGVRGDVALAQSLFETAYFQFGNLVDPKQYNFAGLGATGPGHPGYTFDNAQLGIRAQIQHLKAYASTKPLNKTCIDERFGLVSRGVSHTMGGLSGRWAVPGIGYGDSIVKILNEMAAA